MVTREDLCNQPSEIEVVILCWLIVIMENFRGYLERAMSIDEMRIKRRKLAHLEGNMWLGYT